jgi:hypothetical protein
MRIAPDSVGKFFMERAGLDLSEALTEAHSVKIASAKLLDALI